jgi:hypothetical protein
MTRTLDDGTILTDTDLQRGRLIDRLQVALFSYGLAKERFSAGLTTQQELQQSREAVEDLEYLLRTFDQGARSDGNS